MAPSGKRFVYARLLNTESEIRLLSSEENDHKQMCFRIETVRLHRAPPYAALSYEWGESDVLGDIRINGGAFNVRQSLYLCLKALKARQRRGTLDHNLKLWADAVCINQSDVEEKNSQVAMMAEIYQNAKEVFAWLGSSQLWEPGFLFSTIGRELVVDPWRSILRTSPSPEMQRMRTKFLKMMLLMCRCRYWSRRWTVQEILLSKRVRILCGEDHDLDLDVLQWMLETLGEFEVDKEEAAIGLFETMPWRLISWNLHTPPDGWSIIDLLEMFKASDCERVHDRVYALRNLSKDGPLVSVNYGDTIGTLAWKVVRTQTWPKDHHLERVRQALCPEDNDIQMWMPGPFATLMIAKSSVLVGNLEDFQLFPTGLSFEYCLRKGILRCAART